MHGSVVEFEQTVIFCYLLLTTLDKSTLDKGYIDYPFILGLNIRFDGIFPFTIMIHFHHFSSSSDDVGNSSASTKEFGSRKRRRKSSRKLEDFAANLVKKMTEKQEQMHKEMVEMIERMEKERIKREEAWKREEMERIKQDEEARAAERSRSLALISLIQKLLGYEIQIPPPAEGSGIREEDEVEVNNNNNSPPLTHNMGSAEVNNNTNSLALIQYVGPAEVRYKRKDFNSSDPSNNRWPDVEVQALIAVRTALEHKFGHMGSKGSIWEEIAGALQGMGYNRSAKKCKEKWENINKYYRRTVGSGKKRPVNSKTCPYFDELDNLYRNGSLERNGNALSNTNNVSIREEKEQGEIS